MCCDENIIYIADIYLGFSYCFKNFVFIVGHVEFRDDRTKGRPHRRNFNLYIYVAEGIIVWDFSGTDKEEFFDNFWLYSWKKNGL